MKVTAVGLEFRLTIGNGQFGSEQVSMAVQGILDPTDGYSVQLDLLLDELRDKVIAQLKRSQHPGVRRGMADYTPIGQVDEAPV
jgi:hypothetical protein